MKRLALNAGLLLASAVVAVIAGELLLRFVGVSHPVFYAFEEKRGFYAGRAGASGSFTREGHSRVVINSAGLRDREHETAKPDNTLRIAVLGDSYAEAMQVDVTETFWAVLERELGSCAALRGRKVEAINFGISGYGTGLEWLTLQKQAWDYDPDIVLLAFLTGNDVRNNALELEQNPKLPYFVLEPGRGALTLRLPEHDSSSRLRRILGAGVHDLLLDHSRIVQLLLQLREGWRLRRTEKRHPSQGEEDGLDQQIYLEPDDPSWRTAWTTTEAIVRGMNDEVRQRGKRLFLATLSNSIQVHPDPQVRAGFAQRLGVADLMYPDRRMMALASNEQIPSVMLAPHLREWAEANGTCVHGFDNAVPCEGHWNPHGHKLAGEVLAREICARAIDPR